MTRPVYRRLMPAALFAACAAALAQAAAPLPQRADPLDATVQVPPLAFRSSLPSHQGHKSAKPIPWREANDTVGRIGGWRAYAREASQPEPAATAASGPMPVPQGKPNAP